MPDGVDKRLLRIRVGEPESAIQSGDPTPGGGVYRGGQFAPTMDELSELSLEQAHEAGLVSNLLPIFDDYGRIDKKKIEEWNPNNYLDGAHINSDVPKFSAAVIIDVLSRMPKLLKALKLSYIENGDRFEQDSLSIYGETIIMAKYTANRGFTGRLVVFPSFYKYVSVPLVGRIPGKDNGLSVAAYAVHHAVGHLMFAKLMFDGKLDYLGSLYSESGWSKHAAGTPGMYINATDDTAVWKREVLHREPTEASKYSPMDGFAESFAQYFTNQTYLEVAFPERAKLMSEILNHYGHEDVL
jgi:hypothetical protein